MAALYFSQGQYAQAEPVFRKVQAVREASLGTSHPDVAETLNNLAMTLRAEGQLGAGERLLRRALAIQENSLGAEHPQVATTLVSLAGLVQEQSAHISPEPLLRRALTIREKALRTRSPGSGGRSMGLAMFYLSQEKRPSRTALPRALAIWEQTLGSEHPQLAAP